MAINCRVKVLGRPAFLETRVSPMGLDQLWMAPLLPDDSLLCLYY